MVSDEVEWRLRLISSFPHATELVHRPSVTQYNNKPVRRNRVTPRLNRRTALDRLLLNASKIMVLLS